MALGPDSAPGATAEFRPGTIRGTGGFFQLAQHVTGQWWLLDSEGRPCFLRAVHGVRNDGPNTDNAGGGDAATRLRRWGFNAVGCGGDGAGRDDGLPFIACVDFCRAVPAIVAPGIRLPDVFDPDWPRRAKEYANFICGAHAALRELVGWVSDDDLAWGQRPGVVPTLLQACLSLEPSFAAYHAAWEFVLASHGGSLEAAARAWATPLPNKEMVRELTRTENALSTRGYLRDEARWTREFSRRYFTTASAAVRAGDPNHLFFGCRFRAPVGANVLSGVVSPVVDALMLHWHELPATGAVADPVLATDVGWADAAFRSDAGAAKAPRARITSVERMIRRARTALRRLARHPAVVGYVWTQWHDEPGEQPPFARGLVHLGGAEALEHTELLADFNSRADALRRGAAKLLSP